MEAAGSSRGVRGEGSVGRVVGKEGQNVTAVLSVGRGGMLLGR